jgi:hypothetical protein
MQDEIFGPLLPVYSYSSIEEVLEVVGNKEKPLALYLFSSNQTWIQRMLTEIQSGNALINDVIFNVANREAPFGGVGHSGMGRYFGKYTFECFSHARSILKRDCSPFWDRILNRYPPADITMLKALKSAGKLPNWPATTSVIQWMKPFSLGVVSVLCFQGLRHGWHHILRIIWGILGDINYARHSINSLWSKI